MNLTLLQNKLLAAARATQPSDAVPYAFERRIMARLGSTQPLDSWALWGQALWRSAMSCIALTLLCGAVLGWVTWQERHTADFSQQIETAVYFAAGQADESW